MSQGFARCLLPYHVTTENLFSFLHCSMLQDIAGLLKNHSQRKLSILKKIQVLHFKKLLFWLRVKVFITYQFC